MTERPGSAKAISLYEERAQDLAARFSGGPNAAFYAPMRHLMPTRGARVADIGTALGRDARWFADMGHTVTGAEPVARFLDQARQSDDRITWVQDSLPDLPRLTEQGLRFDFLNLSGVWHHLDAEDCRRAAQALAGLTAPAGLINLALRLGPVPPGLPVFAADADETAGLFTVLGFDEVFRGPTGAVPDESQPAGVTWTWLVLAKGEGDAA